MEWVSIIISVAALTLTFGNLYVAKEKFRFDLFKERLTIYQATRNFIGQISREYTPSWDDIFLFRSTTSEARFLFGDEVVEYLESLYMTGVDMHTNQELIDKDRLKETERTQRIHKQAELFRCLTDIKKLNAQFDPYMRFNGDLEKFGFDRLTSQ